jgi:hypothetical protein
MDSTTIPLPVCIFDHHLLEVYHEIPLHYVMAKCAAPQSQLSES